MFDDEAKAIFAAVVVLVVVLLMMMFGEARWAFIYLYRHLPDCRRVGNVEYFPEDTPEDTPLLTLVTRYM
jgi:hypothetical protein